MEDLELKQIDVVMVFPYEHLNENEIIYIEIYPGYPNKRKNLVALYLNQVFTYLNKKLEHYILHSM